MCIDAFRNRFAFSVIAIAIASTLGVAAVLAQDSTPKACTLSESVQRVRWRDLPSEPTEAHVCAEVPLTPDESGLVKCRVYWKLLQDQGTRDVLRNHCSDYSFLSPASQDPFAALDGTSSAPGEVCSVRQITSADAKRGKRGWYYLSSAPTRCPNLAPDLVMPTDRPEVIDIYTQCAMTKTIVGRDKVVEIDTAACIQPKASEDATDVGTKCEVPMTLNRSKFNLSLGQDTCASGVCLQTPLREQVCSAPNGVPGCTGTATQCSCRCAGAEGDPGPFCTCPDDHECRPLVSELAGSTGTRGSYCVPTDARL